jgi:hypothetical protein
MDNGKGTGVGGEREVPRQNASANLASHCIVYELVKTKILQFGGMVSHSSKKRNYMHCEVYEVKMNYVACAPPPYRSEKTQMLSLTRDACYYFH